MADLTAKQKKIAKQAGDPNKIDAADFKKLREKPSKISKAMDEDRTKPLEEDPGETIARGNRIAEQEASEEKIKKKYGGKITYKMTGGQVVDSSYD
jgi:hypothetical protein